jgi:Carboxypeptidase regulatory-like domain/TonB-dependent Receptor Plug Domain
MPKIEAPFRRFAVWTIVMALWICLSQFGHADSSTANLLVYVSDSSGAVIPRAHLVLRNSDTNQEQQTDSGSAGSATFSFLKPGHYILTVSKDAFADIVVDHILLNVGDEKHLQLSLKVGSAAQTVTVDASGLSINTTDASVSTVIDQKFVENIPLNGRSFQDLISMTPGVVTQSPQAGSSLAYNGDFSVNGQRTESNYYTVDGVTGNTSSGNGNGVFSAATGGTLGGTTALGTTQSLISVDALQEFRVQSSTYSAEYGRSPGGQFSLLTRSGTNGFHGTIFDYLRNNFFDANDWFNDHYGRVAPALRQNDFGGTFGGPVRFPALYSGKSKTFFFASYEGLRLTQPQAATVQYVPDLFLREQAPVALQPILNAYPLPNGIDYGSSTKPSLAQFIEGYSSPSRIDSTSVRVDQSFGPKLAVFFRYGRTPSSTAFRQYFGYEKSSINAQTYTLGVTSQLSSSITNEFRLGYDQGNSSSIQTLDSFGGATPIDLGAALGGSSTGQNYMLLNFSGIGSAELGTLNASSLSRQWNVVDAMNVTSHHHQFKFGFDYRRLKSPTAPGDPLIEGAYYSASSVLSNTPLFALAYHRLPATPIFNETALFVQDEWHPSNRLSISLGLRWEVNPAPGEAHGDNAYTLLGSIGNPASLTLAPQGTPLWKTTWYNFAPRLGTAYTAYSTPGWETIIRAGGGVFFDTDNELATLGYDGVGFVAYKQYLGAPLPVTPAQLDFRPSTNPPYTSSIVYAFPSHLQLPYTLEWNVSVEQALGSSQSMTMSYVGSNGRRLLGEQELSLSKSNPNFGYVFYFPNGITSNYQALQVKFQRSVTHGVHALASYTWSHSIDLGSTASALPLTRGNSDFDVRHNFQTGLSWDITSKLNNRPMQYALSSWGLDGRVMLRTGFPVTLNGNQITDPATGMVYSGGVNLIPGRPVYLYGSQYPGGARNKRRSKHNERYRCLYAADRH